MRLAVGIEKFLHQREVESDWTVRSVASYYRDLIKLVEDHGRSVTFDNFEGRAGTELIRETIGRHWGHTSSATRARVISEYHSFFDWAEGEDLIEANPSTRIKRPPKRKPKVYRPTEAEMMLGRRATTLLERPAWLLMEGVGCRVGDVIGCQWKRLDLTAGRVHLFRKGHDWQWVPIAPDILDALRDCYRQINPDPDHYVFTAETEQWVTATQRVRRMTDPTKPLTEKTVWRMVGRVCKRAGLPPFHPHQLRHGFANRFVRESRAKLGFADVQTLQFLMGHSRVATTQGYIDELLLEDAEQVLNRVYGLSQAPPGETTEEPPLLVAPPFWSLEAAGIEPAAEDSRDSDARGIESEGDDDPPIAPGSGPEGRH